ncbi:MAG: hypothetical protein AAGD18_17500 [Actinomycetota bacterium]
MDRTTGAQGSWSEVEDPDGVFLSADVFEEGEQYGSFSSVEVVEFLTTRDGRRLAVGSERVGQRRDGALWEGLDDGGWRRVTVPKAHPTGDSSTPRAATGAIGDRDEVVFRDLIEYRGRILVFGVETTVGSGDPTATSTVKVWASDDLQVWEVTELPSPGSAAITVHGVVAADGGLVVVGNRAPSDNEPAQVVVWSSSDGAQWGVAVPSDFAAGSFVSDLTATGDLVVAAGFTRQETEQASVWVSRDFGGSWTAVPLPTASALPISSVAAIEACQDGIVAVGSSRAVGGYGWEDVSQTRRIFGEADLAVWLSADAVTWTAQPTSVTPERLDTEATISCGRIGHLLTTSTIGPERAFTSSWLIRSGGSIDPVAALNGRTVTASTGVEDGFVVATHPLPGTAGGHVSTQLWRLGLDP